MSKAYIGGTFDLPHNGHFALFQKAKSVADIVIVSLNTDEFVKRYKGHYPVLSFRERMEIIQACKYVDIVDVNDGDEDSTVCILRHKPDYIVHGDDWQGDSLMKQMNLTKEFLDTNHIELKYFPYTQGVSTTDIKRRIREQ